MKAAIVGVLGVAAVGFIGAAVYFSKNKSVNVAGGGALQRNLPARLYAKPTGNIVGAPPPIAIFAQPLAAVVENAFGKSTFFGSDSDTAQATYAPSGDSAIVDDSDGGQTTYWG